ncbi:MAG: general secretion pathway protein GspK [Candidatus Omnitrophica bacterium]|nr:general secretion pathway protein GspK [Candidatus Omnitrophota bacterium]
MSVLTVIAVMGVSFLFSMNLETQAARHFSEATKARYLAEGGIAVARALLDEDRLGSRVDELTESWVSHFAGGDVDIDADRTHEARWWLLNDPAGDLAGRYAVLIHDEAGKANLNTAVADPEASGIDAVNLTTLLTQAGIADASSLAAAIESYRYGPDTHPGVALVDDDRDGTVDEPDEYQALALRGDDRRFESLEEILSVGGLDIASLRKLATMATVYSWDTNLNLAGTARVNLNTATAEELLAVLLEVGADDPWQMAANMADYADTDLAISRVSKTAIRHDLTDQGPLGDWRWEAASPPPGYYTSQTADGSALQWDVAVPAGSFRILVHGLPGMKVGDVDLNGQSRPTMDSGEAFGILELGGGLTVQVTHREPDGTACAFRGVELVPTDDTGGAGITPVSVRGIEAIRFNELMISPTTELSVSSAVFDPQTSAWACTGGDCANSGTGQARWSWTSPEVRPGQYYVWVFGQSGQTVGEVRVEGQSATLVHGQRHPKTLTVGSDQKVSVTIGKTPADGTYRFQQVRLSLEPDAEYVELINLSDADVDVSGWIIEGEAAGGRQARLPAGSVVEQHGMLVAAVDGDDSQEGLDGNGIDVRSAWELPTDAAWVQLEFLGGDLTPDSDWLKTTVAGGASARLLLRANEWVVDEVEYLLPLSTTAPFQSVEKGDPSVVRDTDQDGIDEGWYPALRLYTPGARNDNEGLRELRGLEQIVHDPSTEIKLLNRPLRSVGELAGLPSGIAWHVVTSGDLAKIADRLTVDGLRLETEGHLADTDGWRETADGYETSAQGSVGTWQWVDVPDGQYRLSLYGWAGEQLTVRWQRADGGYSDWIPVRSMDAQGRIVVGQVTVGLDESPAHTLTLQARCESSSGVCHLLHLWLDPQLTLLGMLNVNTAPKEVLLTLPGMTDLIVDRLIAGRPYGDQEEKARGVGDLLIGSVLGDAEADKLARFRQIAHLVTVRSQVFEILSLGEAMEDGRSGASQRIQAIVQR